MAIYVTNDEDLTAVADAIRDKTGVTGGLVYPDGYVSAVSSIEKVNAKIFTFSSAAAVAVQYVTVVSGDKDVAAHYADDTARVTVTKMTNTDTSLGLATINVGNHRCGKAYGAYSNVTAIDGSASAGLHIQYPLNSEEGVSNAVPHIICNSNGDIKVFAMRQNSNFGGADYLITFTW